MLDSDRTEIEMDYEMIGHRLDLSRPELRPILERYFPRSALIVGGGNAASSLKDALIDDGWQVGECEGPGRSRCPLMSGKPACHLRQSADVAIVYVDGRPTMAITVHDDYQGRGIGAAMLRLLMLSAVEQGVRRLTACVLAKNEPMIRILTPFASEVGRLRWDVLLFAIQLPETPASLDNQDWAIR